MAPQIVLVDTTALMTLPMPLQVALRRTEQDQPAPDTTRRLPTCLAWHPGDPLAVLVMFWDTGRWREWVLARELLALGLSMPVGDGDVHLEPFGSLLLMTVSNPHDPVRTATLQLDATAVADFLTRTYREILLGGETVAVPATPREVVVGDA